MKKLIIALFILSAPFSLKAQTTLSGTVSDSTTTVSSATVILYNSLGELVESIQTVAGAYTFSNVTDGDYFISAKGDFVAYPNHMKTYYGQSPVWNTATSITVSGATPQTGLDILLIQVPNWSATGNTGYCNGFIHYGEINNRAGDPLPGVDIALEQIPGGIIKANTGTDGSGFFEVSKIPNGMTYKLKVDVPGLLMDSTYIVLVTNGDSALNLNFIVDTLPGTKGIYPINLAAPNTISGTISDSTTVASPVGVALFSFSQMAIVDSVLSLDGTYQFDNVVNGNYLIVAKAPRIQYPNHIVTYYGQAPHWANATVVTISNNIGLDNMDITLIQKPNWSGTANTGYCSGSLLYATGQRAGDPIPGVDIALEQIPGGIIKAGTDTDLSGVFEVSKIPNNTKYKLIVDYPGMDIISTDTVEILTGDTVMNLNFVMDTVPGTSGIYFVGETLTSVYSPLDVNYKQIRIYPNPSSGVFYLELTDKKQTVSVTNINGKVVYNKQITSNMARLDLTQQSKGIYFVEIKGNFGTEKHKVIVE